MRNNDRHDNKSTANRTDSRRPNGNRTGKEDTPDPATFVHENQRLLSRILAYGDREAQAYALAVVANGASPADIESIQEQLDELKEERQSG